jgi:two-component system, OmpR family, response regulator
VHHCTVLIVDEEPQVRSLIRAVLSKNGFLTVEANDGITALSTLQDFGDAIDVIIYDYSAPGCGGATFAVLLKSLFPAVPIIVMSDGEAEYDSLSIDIHIPKPFVPAELRDTVRRLCGRHSQAEKGRWA